jgi:hypothetical protein
MKKIVPILFFCLSAMVVNGQDSTPQKDNNIFEQLQKMQKQMMQQFGNMFDTTNMGEMDMPMLRVDSSMTKSFGYLFDGENFKQFGDSTMMDMFKGLEGNMLNFKDLNLEDMMKGFGKMFGDDNFSMPRIEPYDRKKSDEPSEKKKKKYDTEKI